MAEVAFLVDLFLWVFLATAFWGEAVAAPAALGVALAVFLVFLVVLFLICLDPAAFFPPAFLETFLVATLARAKQKKD